jgi:polyhydroxyalkanoate synthesis regulator phasin
MRAKTITDLLSLSVNLYLLSKDEKFLEELADLKAKGKQKAEDLYNVMTGTEEGEHVIDDFLEEARKMKAKMEERADEIAKIIYEKMHIAHADEINRLTGEIDALKATIAQMEERLNQFQQKNA